MKLMKSLMMYCIIIIFIMSLTSSFELGHAKSKSISKLSVKSEKMYEVFYNSPKEETSIPTNQETNDPSDMPSSPETTPDILTEYNIGDSGEEVFSYQKLLYYMDYLKILPDGNFGDGTKAAVEKYQTSKKLEVTGKLDSVTLTALLSEKIEYSKGKTGNEIKDYQMILYYLDYLSSYPEGEYGSGTETAVKKYQKDNSLEETGNIDIATQESLKNVDLTFKPGKRGNEIKEYQSILITLGYLSGTADGHLGTNSVNAIKKYQNNNNLQETGSLDIPTQTSLKKPIEDQVEF